MVLLLHAFFGKPEDWRNWFAAEMPELELRIFPDIGGADDIEVVAAAAPEPGTLGKFPNLKLIVSLLAGQEILLADPHLPEVPITRANDPNGDAMINDTALMHVLRHHRSLPALAAAQARRAWIKVPMLRVDERSVGVMGLGAIGRGTAVHLARYGFKVAGWARSPHRVENVETFHGRDQLGGFLARSEILVNLLPETAETIDVLNKAALAQLPKGAAIINLGRGPHIVDEDLIAALDSGHLAAATLDVFREEPLPPAHPFWAHPKVTVIPHSSRRLDLRAMVPRVCAAIRRLQAGQPPLNIVDPKRGY